MTDDLRALDNAIHASPGATFINRTRSRSFSVNIFRTNARELLLASRQVRDPDYGIHLMALDNREAGEQAHREINRLVHNFVASAMTLVGHTRQFMREHYSETAIESAYKDQVKANFASEPVAKFVQDLRNYMVHKGLPDSQMFLQFDNTAEAGVGGGEITTGVRLPTDTLLEWDGWTAPAKAYITAAGKHLDIHAFAESYFEKTLAFHQWLDTTLFEFHAADLEHLQTLQAKFDRLAAEAATHARFDNSPLGAPASGGSERIGAPQAPSADPLVKGIDETGRAILSCIRLINFPPGHADSFVSDRPAPTVIQQDEIIGTPIAWGSDSEGRCVVTFMRVGSETYGLDGDTYEGLGPLSEKVLQLPWAKNTLSRRFIEGAVIDWCRSSFRSATSISLSDAIADSARKHVAPLEVWAPIANFEVESAFEFGSTTIAPVSAAMMNELEAKGIAMSPDQREDVVGLFRKLREQMQGYAAVVVRMKAERNRASDEALSVAQNAVGLLRFFSPVASQPWQASSMALSGAETVPIMKLMILGEQTFSFSEGLIFNFCGWRLSNTDLARLRRSGLEKAGKLVSSDGLNEFALAVRAGLLLYGTSTTMHNHADRLVYVLSAVEGLLIRHSMEPAELNVEERLMLLVAEDKPSREAVAKNVREVYRMRKRHGTTLTPREQNSLVIFVGIAHGALSIALGNVDRFTRKADFIDAIEMRKSTPAREPA